MLLAVLYKFTLHESQLKVQVTEIKKAVNLTWVEELRLLALGLSRS